MPPAPIYTPENCKFAFQLRWTLTLFWNASIYSDDWLRILRAACSKDGVRILRHRFTGPECSQFLISTKPATKPSRIIWSVKGRLQKIVHHDRPRAFQRNYDLHSVGSTKLEKAEAYVARQLPHHFDEGNLKPLGFEDLQFLNPELDLSQPRFSAHGRFRCNLHVVFIRARSGRVLSSDGWMPVREMIRRASAAKNHLLSRLGIVPDHMHMTLGVHPDEQPAEVALSYMNNIAFVQEMKPVLIPSCFIGTVGEYDLGVMGGG